MSTWWTQRTPRERILFVLCATVLVVAAWLLLTPPPSSGQKLLPAAVAHRQFDEAVRQKIAMDGDVDRLTPMINGMTYAEAPDALVPVMVKRLQERAKESSLHLREVKPLRVRKTASVTRVPVSVRFTTLDFSRSAVAFLYRVEDPADHFVVDKVSVTASDPKSRTVDVEVQVAAYSRSSSGPAEPVSRVSATEKTGD